MSKRRTIIRLYAGLTAEDFMKENPLTMLAVVETTNADKFNRLKFNRMDWEEQKVYEAYLDRPRTDYRMVLSGGSFYKINKTQYKALSAMFPERVL